MSKQEINIQNNTGTINIYNTSEPENKDQKKISMAAVDKYSTPLTAEVYLSPWGDSMHRVSFLLKNDLIGQVMQQNYITASTQEGAQDVFNKIVDDMNEFKKMAEEQRVHSAIIVPKIWQLMESYEKKYSKIEQPESEDLKFRYTSQEAIENFQGATPSGLLIHDVENHFPSHDGIVKSASSKEDWHYDLEKEKEGHVDRFSVLNNFINEKVSKGEFLVKKAFQLNCELLEGNLTEDSLKDLMPSIISNIFDSDGDKSLKAKALLHLRPLFSYSGKFNKWASQNKTSLEFAFDNVGELGMRYCSSGFKEISEKDYDVFIFDADKTLWDGAKGYEMEEPFTLEGDSIHDSSGKTITFKPGVRDMLEGLAEKGKRIGLVSHSEKEGVDYQDQPVVRLLKEYDILKYFNEMVVVAREFPKSIFIPENERVLFIDDDPENLIDVYKNTDADAANVENVEYSPSSIKESVRLTGTVKVSNVLEYGKDFMPIKVLAADPKRHKEKNEKYWEEKEKGILDKYWYSSEEIEVDDFNNFLENMVQNGIQTEVILDVDDEADMPPIVASNLSVLIKITSSGMKKLSPSKIVEAKRKRIKSKEIPDKPKSKKDLELDHKVPRWKGGKDKKDNLQWIDKKKHKEKTKEEGSFEYGGKDRHKKLKQKGKENYTEYQRETGKAKIKKERQSLGEEGFSKKQRERALKRWRGGSVNSGKMKISSWMMGEGGPSRLTAGEANIIFMLGGLDLSSGKEIDSNPLFIKLQNGFNPLAGKTFMQKISDLVWNLDDVFADIFLMTKDEDFQKMCKEKSESEGISFLDCLKKEVKDYSVSSDKIGESKIVLGVVEFLEPRLRNLLNEAENIESDQEMADFFNDGARHIYKEALAIKDEEARIVSGISESFTDFMGFRENLKLDEYNDPDFKNFQVWKPKNVMASNWSYKIWKDSKNKEGS